MLCPTGRRRWYSLLLDNTYVPQFHPLLYISGIKHDLSVSLFHFLQQISDIFGFKCRFRWQGTSLSFSWWSFQIQLNFIPSLVANKTLPGNVHRAPWRKYASPGLRVLSESSTIFAQYVAALRQRWFHVTAILQPFSTSFKEKCGSMVAPSVGHQGQQLSLVV